MTVLKTEEKQKDGRHKLSEPGPGRPPGTPNKFTNLKQSFLDVFEKIEKESQKNPAIKSFYEWVIKNDKNRAMFYQLISKMLPSNVTIDGDMKLTYILSEKVLPETNPGTSEENDD